MGKEMSDNVKYKSTDLCCKSTKLKYTKKKSVKILIWNHNYQLHCIFNIEWRNTE